MILFDKTYLTISYHSAAHCMIQTWRGFATSDEFRTGIASCIDYMRLNSTTSLISDVKEQGVVKLIDSDWAAQIALPQMFNLGLRQMAFVVPTNVFSEIAVQNFSERADNVLSLKYFQSVEAAFEWVAADSKGLNKNENVTRNQEVFS